MYEYECQVCWLSAVNRILRDQLIVQKWNSQKKKNKKFIRTCDDNNDNCFISVVEKLHGWHIELALFPFFYIEYWILMREKWNGIFLHHFWIMKWHSYKQFMSSTSILIICCMHNCRLNRSGLRLVNVLTLTLNNDMPRWIHANLWMLFAFLLCFPSFSLSISTYLPLSVYLSIYLSICLSFSQYGNCVLCFTIRACNLFQCTWLQIVDNPFCPFFYAFIC